MDNLAAAVPYLAWGILIHRIVDWLLQNNWQAVHKANLLHPAAWVHSGLHAAALWPLFGPTDAALIGLIHILIDTRVPLQWWGRRIGQTDQGEIGLHVKLNRDQVAHEAVIGAFALLKVIFNV